MANDVCRHNVDTTTSDAPGTDDADLYPASSISIQPVITVPDTGTDARGIGRSFGARRLIRAAPEEGGPNEETRTRHRPEGTGHETVGMDPIRISTVYTIDKEAKPDQASPDSYRTAVEDKRYRSLVRSVHTSEDVTARSPLDRPNRLTVDYEVTRSGPTVVITPQSRNLAVAASYPVLPQART